MDPKCSSTVSRLQDPQDKNDLAEPDGPNEIYKVNEACSSQLLSIIPKEDSSRLAKQNDLKRRAYKAAQNDEWRTAKQIIQTWDCIKRISITKGGQTVLHVAAGAGHVRFVKKLLKFLDDSDLAIQDLNGNTALCFAVAGGSRQMVELMIIREPSLLAIPSGQGMSLLYTAVSFGREEIAWLLYSELINVVHEAERAAIFFTCINHNLFELALKIADDYPELSLARDNNGETALHLLAQKPSAFSKRGSAISRTIKHSCAKKRKSAAPISQLLKCVLNQVPWHNERIVSDIIQTPSHALLTAAKLGNFEFVAELINSHPDLIWEIDESNRTVFHIAVMYHHANIFNLVHKLGVYKEFVLSFKDQQKNNILHLAAKRGQLLWFEEVRKVVPAWYPERRNLEGKTPEDIYIEEHKGLSKESSWIKLLLCACFS